VPQQPPIDELDESDKGKGEKDELVGSDKVLLRVPFWVEKITFLLPISAIGVISGDQPLHLL
jgi:hypothetical protein